MFSTPALIVVAPVYVFAPLKVSIEALVFVKPPSPLINPALVPPSTLTTAPVPMLSEPPFSAVIVLLAFKFKVPLLNVVTLAAPPTVVFPPLTLVSTAVVPIPVTPPLTVPIVAPAAIVFAPPLTAPATKAFAPTTPPLMSELSRLATFTTPSVIPPALIVAFDANRVLPTPLNPLSVIVPLVAVKYTLLAALFPLLTLPRLKPTPLTVARPFASTLKVAEAL
jgi:hypothetical protein